MGASFYKAIKFYQKAGFSGEQIEIYKSRFGGFGKAISTLPQSYDRLVDGELGQSQRPIRWRTGSNLAINCSASFLKMF